MGCIYICKCNGVIFRGPPTIKSSRSEEANKSVPPKRLVKMDKFMWILRQAKGVKSSCHTYRHIPCISKSSMLFSRFLPMYIYSYIYIPVSPGWLTAYSLTATDKTFYALFFLRPTGIRCEELRACNMTSQKGTQDLRQCPYLQNGNVCLCLTEQLLGWKAKRVARVWIDPGKNVLCANNK